jgi:SAM-dependent methyltransferase
MARAVSTATDRGDSAARPPGRTARNALNDLTGTEWIRFTRSWFVENPAPRRLEEKDHPAKFPEALCDAFVRFFTRRRMWVLDPFAGTGSTLVAAAAAGRNAIGFELEARFAQVARDRLRAFDASGLSLRLFRRDARELRSVMSRAGLRSVQLVLTSPPYWDMLSKSRGGVVSVHRRRRAAGLSTVYSTDPRDLANLHDYDRFLDATCRILRDAGRALDPGRYLVLIAQNLRDVDGRVRPLAWDLARRLDAGELRFQGERIWCQDSKPLGIWGFPTVFVPNYHHHYCLVFRRQPARGAVSPTVPSAAARRAPARSNGWAKGRVDPG